MPANLLWRYIIGKQLNYFLFLKLKYFLNQKKGLTKINLTRFKRIIITRSISILPCVIITLLAYDSIKHLNFWCNIIKAIQLPFALLPILHFTSSRRIMGSFRTNLLLKTICYLIAFCILSINIYFLFNLIVNISFLVLLFKYVFRD